MNRVVVILCWLSSTVGLAALNPAQLQTLEAELQQLSEHQTVDVWRLNGASDEQVVNLLPLIRKCLRRVPAVDETSAERLLRAALRAEKASEAEVAALSDRLRSSKTDFRLAMRLIDEQELFCESLLAPVVDGMMGMNYSGSYQNLVEDLDRLIGWCAQSEKLRIALVRSDALDKVRARMATLTTQIQESMHRVESASPQRLPHLAQVRARLRFTEEALDALVRGETDKATLILKQLRGGNEWVLHTELSAEDVDVVHLALNRLAELKVQYSFETMRILKTLAQRNEPTWKPVRVLAIRMIKAQLLKYAFLAFDRALQEGYFDVFHECVMGVLLSSPNPDHSAEE